jgi:Domain of unknown function (DUF4917)
MTLVDVTDFGDAIADSAQFAKRQLLFGNGFSIACRPDIFHYGSLFSKADLTSNPNLARVFEALDTQDSEIPFAILKPAPSSFPFMCHRMSLLPRKCWRMLLP